MLKDLLDHLLILNKTDDRHPPLTFLRDQGVPLYVEKGLLGEATAGAEYVLKDAGKELNKLFGK